MQYIHILANTSRSNGNQIMKFVRLLELKSFFLKNYAENKTGRLVPSLFLFFKKALHVVKTKGSAP